jgi:hypothetical protein
MNPRGLQARRRLANARGKPHGFASDCDESEAIQGR